MADGEPSFSLRALLAREADTGLETLAGEVTSAHTVALEAFITALDDVTLERALDERAGVWLFGAATGHVGSAVRAATTASAATAPWAVALEVSEQSVPARLRGGPPAASAGVPMPARPPRPEVDMDGLVPEPGDLVDHFAFGQCEVVRSDGDRLHLRVHKDGRIREIALEMLRVAPLPDAESGGHRFKLERRL